MVIEEAKRKLKDMKIFKNHKLDEDESVRAQYIAALMKYTTKLFDETFELMKYSITFFPSVMEMDEFYRKVELMDKENQKFIQPDTNCYVCENRGVIIYKNEYNNEYGLYCTECDKGKEFQYRGMDIKNNKSEYFIDPVTKHFDIEELRSRNMFKNHNIVPCPVELKQKLRKVGMRV